MSDFPLAEESAARHRAGSQDGAAAEAQERHEAEKSTTAIVVNPRLLQSNASSILYPELKAKAKYRSTHGTFTERRVAAAEIALMEMFRKGDVQLRDLDYATISIDADGSVRVLEDGQSKTLDLEMNVKTPDLEPPADSVYIDELGKAKQAKRDADAAEWARRRAQGRNPVAGIARHTDLNPQPAPQGNHTFTFEDRD